MAARLNAVQVEHASMQAQVKEMQTAVDEREAEVSLHLNFSVGM
jgi:uncharacterized membrane-anchored protein YhcB (DUF1043 family)